MYKVGMKRPQGVIWFICAQGRIPLRPLLVFPTGLRFLIPSKLQRLCTGLSFEPPSAVGPRTSCNQYWLLSALVNLPLKKKKISISLVLGPCSKPALVKAAWHSFRSGFNVSRSGDSTVFGQPVTVKDCLEYSWGLRVADLWDKGCCSNHFFSFLFHIFC